MTVTVKGLPPTDQQKIALREAFGVVGYETNSVTGVIEISIGSDTISTVDVGGSNNSISVEV